MGDQTGTKPVAEYPGGMQNPLVVTAEWCVGTSQSRGGADEVCSGARWQLRRAAEPFVDVPVVWQGAAKAFGGAAG